MDPLHITEFASPRYFDKLKSLNEAAENANATTPAEASNGASQSNTLTLPIRDAQRPHAQRRRRSDDNVRPSDQKRRVIGHDLAPLRAERRPSFALGFVKLKISGGHKVSSTYAEPDDDLVDDEPSKPKLLLSELLLGLPNELQLHILSALPLPTLLNVRLVSKAFHNLVTQNESPLARHHLSYSVPAYATRLYPSPVPAEVNLHYLCGLWHRLHVAKKLSILIADHTTKEIFLRNTEAKWNEFLPQLTRMRRRLMPLLFTIFHFFEKYRELHVRHLTSLGTPLRRQAFTLNPIEKQVMDMYEDDLLLTVHQVFPLVLSAFSRRLRPPSYASHLERAIKGMLKDKPADEVYATILAVGGLRQAERFWETKGYNTRRAAVDQWYGLISHEPAPPSSQKGKLASKFAALGRKKAAPPTEPAMGEYADPAFHEAGSCREWHCVKPGCVGVHTARNGAVFNTSLAAGPPMPPLSREQLRHLLPDLQPLTTTWLQTAEAVILERKIVESSSKIKRNTQVLLELIREDGPRIEEEWTPGLSQVSLRTTHNFTDANAFVNVQDL